MGEPATVDIFRYLDYRAFLRDRVQAEKKRRSSFSHRNFARRIGVRSPAHLARVLSGERRLTRTMAERYARALDLEPEASRYFRTLVSFNEAASPRDRERAYAELSSFRKYREVHHLDVAQGEYCRFWFVPAVRELAACQGFVADEEWIASRLRPRITTREARTALDILFELGLLVKDDDGVVHQRDATVTTGPQTHSVHVTRYHHAMLERAAEALDEVGSAERDFSALTLALPAGAMEGLKVKLAKLRQELLAEYSVESGAERIVQVNVQVFPLTEDL